MARPVTQEARRRDIVDAAIAALGESENGQVSIAEVARRLDLTPNAVRYYFRDAGALLWAVRSRVEQRFLTERLTAVSGAHDPRQKLVRAMGAGLPTGPDDVEWRVTFRPVMVDSPTAAHGRMLAEVLAEQAAIYERILAEGVDAGAFAPAQPLADVARTLMVMEDYLGLRIVMLDPTFSRDEALRLMREYAGLALGTALPDPS
ncbi:TetR family transcriptional regulator [Nocardioides sp. GY 10113]|uniref:TetR/AcrR family transcriptional regulator n=1 Tax=Nocardioides sp. GY 10113 TaxID=2569761 RepID=UPI0010A809B8|nr:TetR/AcrR family transcriptional regulator [Nocardioides sp. GY 10113]TIC88276.1 TetR family transcriptional regulator [Nocardioides sp. GY 10113]